MESAGDTASPDGEQTEQDTSTAVADDAGHEDRQSPSDDTGAGRGFARIRWLAAVVLVAALAGAGYGGWQLIQQHQRDVAAAQALDAAQKFVHTLTNFNSDSEATAIDKNMNGLLDGSTGEFRAIYVKSRAQLLQVQVDNNAAARGTVVDAVVKSATKNKVVLVLFVDQSVTNVALPDPEIDRSRIRMTMEKVDGRWLTSKVDLL